MRFINLKHEQSLSGRSMSIMGLQGGVFLGRTLQKHLTGEEKPPRYAARCVWFNGRM